MATYQMLLVDDEPNNLSALSRTLNHNDYKLTTCADPQEALSLLQNHAYHIVISDYRMPNITGTQLLQHARELQPDCMRIIVSAKADKSALVDAINDAQIYRFVEKPWDNDELNQIITEALKHQATAMENKELNRLTKQHVHKMRSKAKTIADWKRDHPELARVDWSEDGAIKLTDN